MSRIPGVHFPRGGGREVETRQGFLRPKRKNSLEGGCVVVVVVHSTFIESFLGERPEV